jgi:hypothetical protein
MNEEIDEIMMKHLGMDLEEASYFSSGSYLNLYKDAERKAPFLSPSLVAKIVKEIVEMIE